MTLCLEDLIPLISNEEVIKNIVGFVAGTILIVAGLPVLKAQLNQMAKSTKAERQSRVLIGLGNFVWLIYGVGTATWMLCIMCGLQVLINAATAILMYHRINKDHSKEDGS